MRQLLVQDVQRFLLAVTKTALHIVQTMKPAWLIFSRDPFSKSDPEDACRLRASLEPSEDEQECKGIRIYLPAMLAGCAVSTMSSAGGRSHFVV